MEELELVSIIIPAYNAERWIGETINSALNQTVPKKEIIVVDDGSTDDTLSVAKKFESNSIKVVTGPNQGASAARNEGLRLAQGSYIQWLDADDLLAPDKIALQLKCAENGKESRTLFTSSYGTFYFCYQRARIKPSSLWQHLSPVDWLINKFNDNVWMNPAAWLVSRRLTELAGPWNEQLTRDDDGEYICRVVAASEEVEFIGEAMSYYRIGSPTSLSSLSSCKAYRSQLLSFDLCIRCLLALENSERSRRACLNLLQAGMPFIYPEEKEILCEMEELAFGLGGQLIRPEANWKYYLSQQIFGRELSNNVMNKCRRTKFGAIRTVDRVLYHAIYSTR